MHEYPKSKFLIIPERRDQSTSNKVHPLAVPDLRDSICDGEKYPVHLFLPLRSSHSLGCVGPLEIPGDFLPDFLLENYLPFRLSLLTIDDLLDLLID